VSNHIEVTCADCGELILAPEPAPICGGMGYAITKDGKQVCYPCSARRLLAKLREDGKGCLYLTWDEHTPTVTDWTGELRFKVRHSRKGKHNIAGTRYDVWFNLDGYEWWGVQYGEWTQVCHCRRTSRRLAPRERQGGECEARYLMAE